MVSKNPELEREIDKMDYHSLLMIVLGEIIKAYPQSRTLAEFTCSVDVPRNTQFETNFDRERGFVEYVETWGEGGRRELIVGAGGHAWDLTLEVRNSLTPTKIVARKDFKGKVTFDSLPLT